MKFDTKETETYFLEIAKRFGIIHISVNKDTVLTMKDVNLLVKSAKRSQEK